MTVAGLETTMGGVGAGRGGRTALVVVDVQNDFCEGGSLAVEGGADVAARLGLFIQEHAADYDAVVVTRDWHVDPGDHFASATGKTPDFTETWPDHCVAGTDGADFHPLVAGAIAALADAQFRKGEHAAAYSGFEGRLADDGGRNEDGAGTEMGQWLAAHGIDAVHIAGIATDYCVLATALDAVKAGFATAVLTDLCAGVHGQTSRAALEEMAASGVELRSFETGDMGQTGRTGESGETGETMP